MHPVLQMGNWLLDIQTSRMTGELEFRLPYPGGTWIEEKRNNEYLIFLMREARKVAIVGHKQKNNKKLTDEENKLLEEIAESLVA